MISIEKLKSDYRFLLKIFRLLAAHFLKRKSGIILIEVLFKNEDVERVNIKYSGLTEQSLPSSFGHLKKYLDAQDKTLRSFKKLLED